MGYIQYAVRLVVTNPQPRMRTIAFSCSMRSMKTDFTSAGLDLISQDREPELAAAHPRVIAEYSRHSHWPVALREKPSLEVGSKPRQETLQGSSEVGDGARGE